MPSVSFTTPPFEDMVKALNNAQAHRLGEIQDHFTKWDKDKDGFVDKVEFRRAMRALKLPGHDDEDTYAIVCDAVFAQMDVDNSGMVSYGEYIRLTRCNYARQRRRERS